MRERAAAYSRDNTLRVEPAQSNSENAIGGTVLSRISPLTAPLKLNVRGIWRQQGFRSHFLRVC